jgi:hypothetical protein
MAHFTLHTLLVICVAASLFIWSRRPRASGKVALWIGALLLAALLVEIAGRLLPLSGRINAPVYNLFTMLEFALVLRIVGVVRPRDSWWLTGSLILGTGMMAYNFVQQGNLDFFLVYGIITQSALAILWSSLGLWSLAQRTTRQVWKAPLFWFFMGTTLYFAGIIPYLGFLVPLFKQNPPLSVVLYNIITVVAITRYLFTAWACHLAHTQGSWDDER